MNHQAITNIKTKPIVWFVIFCSLHLLIWTLLPTLLYGNPPKDLVEGIAWGNLWLWGYEKHPFLAPWLTALATDLAGGRVGWPVYLLGQLSVITCFWAVWRLANKVLSPWHSLLAVVLLEGLGYYSMEAANFNPNILMLPLWACASLVFYNALKDNQIKWWVLLGIFTGLAMVAKYESAVLYGCMLVVLLSTASGRASFKRPGIYCAIAIAVIIFLPNFIWLAQHNFDALSYATDKLSNSKNDHLPMAIALFYHPLRFTVSQALCLLPALFLYIPFYKGAVNKFQTNDFDRRFLLVMGLGPLLVTLLFSLVTNSELTSSWGVPFFSLTGILWLAWSQPIITKQRLGYFFVLTVFLVLVHAAQEVWVSAYSPYHAPAQKKANVLAKYSQFFPGQAIAVALTQQWHDLYHSPIPYAAGDHDVVINIAAYSPDKPIAYFNVNLADSPWIDEAQLKKKGGVFVVIMNDPILAKQRINNITQRFPGLTHPSVQTFPLLTKADSPPLKVWVAFLAAQN